jgi:hypothetical protein
MVYRFGLVLLLLAPFASFSQIDTVGLAATWKAEFKDSLGSGTANVILRGTSGNLSGEYRTNGGGQGSIALHKQSNQYEFVLMQTTDGCSGSYSGLLEFTDSKLMGSYSGNDCKGWHENGVLSMVRVDTANTENAEQSGSVLCDNPSATGVPLWREGKLVRNLGCGERLMLLSKSGAGYVHVRTRQNEEGYIREQSAQPSPGSQAESVIQAVVPVEQIPPIRPSKLPAAYLLLPRSIARLSIRL